MRLAHKHAMQASVAQPANFFLYFFYLSEMFWPRGQKRQKINNPQ
jgi:hypothetical protein